MYDIRKQIYEKLKTICDNVKFGFPEGKEELPMITYIQVTNITAGKWNDNIDVQIDVYTNSLEDSRHFCVMVDEVLTELGLRRTYISSDADARMDIDLYHYAINYNANINTHSGNIIPQV